MATSPVSLKKHAQLSLAALAVLFVLSIIFYKERVFFADAAYILFNIIKYKRFYIQEQRWGSFISQLLPVAGVKQHLPIAFIVRSYALGFNLFYLLVGLVVYRCRQYGLVVIMALYYFLLVSDSFYWTNNEIHQAVAWMFLLLAVTLRMAEQKISQYVLVSVFLVLAFCAIYTHFIVLIPLTFLWVFLLIQKGNLPLSRNMSIILTVCFGLIIAAKLFVVKSNSYDEEHLHHITHLSLHDVLLAFTTSVIKKFVLRCFTNYWLGIIVFVLGLVHLFRDNKKTIAWWCIVSFVGYMLLMGITYADLGRDVLLFHIESEWQCLSVILSVPFVIGYLPKLTVKSGLLFLALIFLVRLLYIGVSSRKFSERYEFVHHVMDQMREQHITKLALVSTPELEKKYMLLWAAPDESMLISSMEGSSEQISFTFVDTSDKTVLNNIRDPKLVLAAFEVNKHENWDYEYFKPDTLHPYNLLTIDELLKK